MKIGFAFHDHRAALLTIAVLAVCPLVQAGDSPQFRGPGGEGHSAEKNLPVNWSESENIRWKTDVDGLGWSTPSIEGSQVWLTTATDEGKSLRIVCLDKTTGTIVHNVELFHHDNPGSIHKKNSFASPSVLIDGNNVYAHFGKLGTACLDRNANVIWKTELKYNHRHGPAGSPIVFENLLILACDGGDTQYVTALDKATGKEIWKTTREGAMAYSTPLLIQVNGRPQLVSTGGEWAMGYEIVHNVELFHHDNPGSIHKKNSFASPSVLIDGNNVYAHFGKLGTACLDRNANVIWKTELKYNHRHGPAGSPIVFENLLILACDGGDTQYVTALDKATGKEIWKTTREGAMAYSTPLLIQVNGRPQLVSTGGEWAMGYEPKTGKEVWRFRYPKGYSNVPRPVYGEGLVFLCSGYDKPWLYAVKPTGEGDVTESHMAWKLERGAPLNPSPLLLGADLYIVSDNGIAQCLDAKTGEPHWQQRLGGNFSASPLLADGRLYFLDELGKAYVVEPTNKEYKELAVNTLPGRTLASIAAADGALFLRTDTSVYRIQKGK